MKGYWNLPDETDRVFRPGLLPGERVLYTGDLFKMDEAGFLYFISRKDDVIKVGGERVSPKEIENVLHEIRGVNEAAVIGVNDEIETFLLKNLFALYKYPPDPMVIRDNNRKHPLLLKSGKEFRIEMLEKMEKANRQNLGGIPNPLLINATPEEVELGR